MERDDELEYIKRRMQELGLNQRSLALRAGCKEDAVRNRLSGKAKRWRSDTHQAIMRVLEEETDQASPQKVSDTAVALTFAIKSILQVLIDKKLTSKHSMQKNFQYALGQIQQEGLQGAEQVMTELLEYVADSSPSKTPEKIRRLLQLAPQGSA